MRILQLTAWYPPHSTGGTEVYVQALTQAVKRSGHTVAVAGPLAGLPQASSTVIDDVAVFRYPIPGDPTRDEARGRVRTRGSDALIAWARAWRPDVVHLHSLTTGLQMPELRALVEPARALMTAHLPSLTYICQRGTLALWGQSACDGLRLRRRCAACALTARGIARPVAAALACMPMPVARSAANWPAGAATALAMPALIDELAAQQNQLFDLLDAVVVLNTAARRILDRNGAPPAKVRLNPLGISHVPTPKPGPDVAPTRLPIRIGFFGRLSRDKGIDDLLSAVEHLPRDLPLAVAVYGVAAGGEGEKYVDLIRAASARGRAIELHPALPPREVAGELARIDLLCAPSRWFENGPTIALESVAAGTPVIGTKLGGFCDLVQDDVNGRLIDPGDVGGLVRLFTQVAADPAGTIDRWRRHLPPVRTMADISADYLRLYAELAAGVPRAVVH